MKIIDKRNGDIETKDVLPGEIFEDKVGIYLKIEPFCVGQGDECNCVDLLTNEVCCVNGKVKIITGAFVVGEK